MHPSLTVLFALPLALLPLAVSAQDARSLSGSVTYRDRMALSPEAVLLLEATGPDGGLLAEARIATEGRQVPIPFALDLPEGAEGTLRAGLAMEGQIVWLADPVPLTAETDDLGELMLPRFQPIGFTSAFRCGDRSIQVGFAGETAVMDTGTDRLVLQAVPTASGARFEAANDPGTWFWNQGDSALVSLAGAELPECRMALPMDAGPYTAGGNEPFWSIRIETGALLLTRLGMEDLTLPVNEATLTEAGDILVTATDPDRALRAVILRRATLCHDTMSGLPHPETVEVSMGDETVTGCGGDPWALLTGRTWVVEDIAGAGIIDASRVTLGFGTDGRVAGSGGCNRWFAGYTLTGEGLSIGQAGSTMMACPNALMDQERRFFEALAQVTGFDIDDGGALVLLAAGQPILTARAATDGSAP